MQLHLSALYTCDGNGHMVGCNQFNGGPVPRLHLATTRDGNVCAFRADVPARLQTSLRRLVSREPPLTEARSAPVYQQEYLALLADDAPVEAIWHGPAYRFSSTACDDEPNVVDITESNRTLLAANMGDWLIDVPHRRPFKALVVDGQAVAVCASVRITSAAHEAGVETIPSYRRRGAATSVVSAWAKATALQGAEPLYSTSWDNLGSQAVARSLGLEFVGTDFHVR